MMMRATRGHSDGHPCHDTLNNIQLHNTATKQLSFPHSVEICIIHTYLCRLDVIQLPRLPS